VKNADGIFAKKVEKSLENFAKNRTRNRGKKHKGGMIICGFAAIGKSTLGEKFSNCVDMETGDYRWIYKLPGKSRLERERRKGHPELREPNPNWPQNYIDETLKNYRAGKIVLCGLVSDAMDYFRENGITFYGTVVNENIIGELYERSLERGNPQDFADGVLRNFDKFNERALSAPRQIYISEDVPNLEIALRKMGVKLVPRNNSAEKYFAKKEQKNG
jgi:hypothetical protein